MRTIKFFTGMLTMKRYGKSDVPFLFILVYDREIARSEALRTQFLQAAYKFVGVPDGSKPMEVVLACETPERAFWGGNQEICDYLHRGAFEPSRNMRSYEVQLPD